MRRGGGAWMARNAARAGLSTSGCRRGHRQQCARPQRGYGFGRGLRSARTVSGNSSVADCSRFLSSRSPKKMGSGFVSINSGTAPGSIGSASKRRPGRVDVPGTGSASPTGGEETGLLLLDGGSDVAGVIGGSVPHLEGSEAISFMRVPHAASKRWPESHRVTT